MTLKLVATCLFGLEHILGEEIDALGYKRISTIDGRVTFEGDITAIARCNLWLRTESAFSSFSAVSAPPPLQSFLMARKRSRGRISSRKTANSLLRVIPSKARFSAFPIARKSSKKPLLPSFPKRTKHHGSTKQAKNIRLNFSFSRMKQAS